MFTKVNHGVATQSKEKVQFFRPDLYLVFRSYLSSLGVLFRIESGIVGLDQEIKFKGFFL